MDLWEGDWKVEREEKEMDLRKGDLSNKRERNGSLRRRLKG